jgi:beta-phosphoglucomutase-like phosphatase (HAD superfamily)
VTALSELRPRAVVFDLDGTLVDNMTLHAQAFERFAQAHDLPPLTMDLRRRIDGKRNSEIFPMLFEREMTMDEVLEFEEEKEGAYRQLSRGRLVPVRGALTLLSRLERLRVPADECLAFEDAPIGVAAAVAAGMTCVGVATTFSPEQFNAHIPAPLAVLPDYESFLQGPGRWLLDG